MNNRRSATVEELPDGRVKLSMTLDAPMDYAIYNGPTIVKVGSFVDTEVEIILQGSERLRLIDATGSTQEFDARVVGIKGAAGAWVPGIKLGI